MSVFLNQIVSNKEELAERLYDRYCESKSETTPEIDEHALMAQKAKIEKQMGKYMDMYANEVISMEMLKEKTAAFKADIKRIEDQLSAVAAAEDENNDAKKIIEAAMEEIERFLKLENATNVDLRKIVSSILVNEKHEIKINLKVIQQLNQDNIPI